MTFVNRRLIPVTDAKPEKAITHCGLILEADDDDRYLIGYGITALLDALNGMGRTLSSLNDVQAIYIADDDYDHYVADGMWRELFLSRKENRQNDTTIRYMLRKGLIRRGEPDAPELMPCHRAAWSLAVHGRLMRLM